MALILNLETSSTNCSVSIAKNGILLHCKELNEGFSHSENLLQFVADVLQEIELDIKTINAVAVSSGPGSYTGLRIGVSAAKGFCFGLDIPLIAIDSLSVLANQVLENHMLESPFLLLPMFDARRMEVYSCILNEMLTIIDPISAVVLNELSYMHIDGEKNIYFFGDGANKAVSIFSNRPQFRQLENLIPSAKNMCDMSYKKFVEKKFEDIAYFEPNYLKEFYTNAKPN
jgi:tRNA threonylcarbamoyladenosine biosynthesis protein TsaB